MNERIEELMPKPWTFPYPDRELYTKEQLEKFAELIVRECADYITESAFVETLLGKKLLERFGVES